MADEYIRRQDAIDAFNRIKNTLKNPETAHYDTLMFYEIEDVLEDVKPADVVQVVHAHWIQTSTEDENGNAYYYCSNCGRGESHNPIVEVPYCWKCGAKMDAHGEEQYENARRCNDLQDAEYL